MSSSKRGLQGNPLEQVIPDLRNQNGVEENKRGNGVKGKPSPQSLRKRFTAHVRQDIVERAKNAVYWTPGLTMAQLVESGLALAIEKLEKSNGGPFKERATENPGGRPLT